MWRNDFVFIVGPCQEIWNNDRVFFFSQLLVDRQPLQIEIMVKNQN